MSATHFNEDQCTEAAGSGSRHLNESDERHTDFDLAEVERALGEEVADIDAETWARLVMAQKSLDEFRIGSGPMQPGRDTVIGRRSIAMAWVIDPSLFGGKSLSSIARDLGVSPAALAVTTAEFSRRFKVRTACQCHGSGRFRPADDDAREPEEVTDEAA